MYRIAGYYWRDIGNCNAVIGDTPRADLSDFLAASIRVNGRNRSTGYPNDWDVRLQFYRQALETLQVEGREEAVAAIDPEIERYRELLRALRRGRGGARGRR